MLQDASRRDMLSHGARLQQMIAATVAASMRPAQHRPAALLLLAFLIPLTAAARAATVPELARLDGGELHVSASRTSGHACVRGIRWHGEP